MRSLLIWVILAALSCCVTSAAETCPWLNSATAAGVLGGVVTTKVTPAGQEASCEFTRASVPSKLLIEVHTMADVATEFPAWLNRCPSKFTAVRGTGNQAVACDILQPPETAAQIISRVRNRAFAVRVSTSQPAASLASLREQADGVAQQVAGILF